MTPSSLLKLSSCVLGLALLGACAPPDYEVEVDQQPVISVIFPSTDTDAVYCSSFMVTVDIDNLDVFYPADEEPLVEGEGHWHLVLPNSQVRAIGTPYYFLDGGPEMPDPDNPDGAPLREAGPDGPFVNGGTYSFRAEMTDNQHAPLADFAPVVFEITIDDESEDEEGNPNCLGGGGGGGNGGY